MILWFSLLSLTASTQTLQSIPAHKERKNFGARSRLVTNSNLTSLMHRTAARIPTFAARISSLPSLNLCPTNKSSSDRSLLCPCFIQATIQSSDCDLSTVEKPFLDSSAETRIGSWNLKGLSLDFYVSPQFDVYLKSVRFNLPDENSPRGDQVKIECQRREFEEFRDQELLAVRKATEALERQKHLVDKRESEQVKLLKEQIADLQNDICERDSRTSAQRAKVFQLEKDLNETRHELGSRKFTTERLEQRCAALETANAKLRTKSAKIALDSLSSDRTKTTQSEKRLERPKSALDSLSSDRTKTTQSEKRLERPKIALDSLSSDRTKTTQSEKRLERPKSAPIKSVRFNLPDENSPCGAFMRTDDHCTQMSFLEPQKLYFTQTTNETFRAIQQSSVVTRPPNSTTKHSTLTALRLYVDLREGLQLERQDALLVSGSFVAAEHSDGLWHRAQLLSSTEDGVVLVRFVDYGNDQTLPPQSIRSLPPKLTKRPLAFALKCKLRGCPELSHQTLDTYLSTFTTDRAIFYAPDGHVLLYTY